MYDTTNESERFGSARFAVAAELRRAGLLSGRGLPYGFVQGQPLTHASDAPCLTVAGAGAGKLRDLLGYVMCMALFAPDTWRTPFMALDPRGELGAISQAVLAPNGVYGYYWNMMRLCGLPHHDCNPLDILRRDSLVLISDAQFIAEGLVLLSGSGSGKYFELRAREWIAALLVRLAERDGEASFPALYELIGLIEGNPELWADELEAMLASPHAMVRRAAGEILVKQQDGEREFGAIMGEIYAYTAFLNDPALRETLGRSEFSLRQFAENGPVIRVHLNVPAEYLSLWSPLLRTFFTVAMLYKTRAPSARRVTLLVDEAGQLGRFDGLLRAFSYGRGAGIKAWALFQDIGQIVSNFGEPGLQGFLGSAQLRQFFGVRDYRTAELVSNMLGTQTLEFDDEGAQAEARMKRREMARAAFRGGASLLDAAMQARHYAEAEQRRTKMARPLMTPDEILAMPEDRQILFISGKNIRPVYAEKQPYYERADMAGRFVANPYHPPSDAVRVRGRFGMRQAEIVEGPVPGKYAHFPQYKGGRAVWVRGFPF